ncbi:MAG TPA: histidine ammonia-lyase [Candidatus Fermentibacter daniensis]|nr:histidine ammonia-lyase [Candidatus Fermentibacter daniensis]HPK51775.1 histidine ammonia-lyase [Candidatus Fermentibacter daniensis]
MSIITIECSGVGFAGVEAARAGAPAVLAASAREAVAKSRAAIDAAVSAVRPTYGINTGFGRLASTVIDGDSLAELQRNLLVSHACGTGPLVPPDIVRVAMILRAASLARGRSGIRPETLDCLLAVYNAGIIPAVPSRGSLGASGDLAPLAHMCLPLLGEGEVLGENGAILPGAAALASSGIAPVVLQAKEGLALINGTPVLTAYAACSLLDLAKLMDAADVAAAMSAEVLLATTSAFDAELVALRPHPGAVASALNLRAALSGSAIVESHRDCPRVQDAYSIRCTPQVHGASRDAARYAGSVISVELASVTDNPLMLPDGSFQSGGNFHGQPVAFAADHLCLAASELGAISERRTERLLNPDLSGLPAFLAARPGLDSGLMIAQYTSAALASENKILCHPASVDSIPVSGAQEDHVSMGAVSARKAMDVVTNARYIVATELYCAFRAYAMLDRQGRGAGTGAAFDAISTVASTDAGERRFDGEIAAVGGLIASGEFSRILSDCGGVACRSVLPE